MLDREGNGGDGERDGEDGEEGGGEGWGGEEGEVRGVDLVEGCVVLDKEVVGGVGDLGFDMLERNDVGVIM